MVPQPNGRQRSLACSLATWAGREAHVPGLRLLPRHTSNGIQASIVDPHGNHLSDAGPKLRGLADYAEKHSAEFHRIDAVIELDGKVLALDLRSESVRQAVKTVVDSDVKSLFSTHGGAYN